jgi:hypothetical protein
MTTAPKNAPDWALAERECRGQMDAWVRDASERQRRIPWLGYSDEATFMAAMIPYYFLTGDEQIKDLLFEMRGRWRAWTQENFHHGYYKRNAEEHHQTEDYYRVFGRLWYLVPFDEVNLDLLDDMVEHLGNWVGGIPKWYDWERHRFVSRYIGTWYVNDDPEFSYNSPGFFRYLLIAFQAYLATGRGQYLDLCVDYSDRWCQLLESIPEGDPIPVRVNPEWNVIQTTPDGSETGVGLRAGYTYMTGGFIGTMLDLYGVTRNRRYADNARRILSFYLGVPERDRPMNNIVASALAQYRLATGDSLGEEETIASADEVMQLPLPDSMSMPGRPPNTRLTWRTAGGDSCEQYQTGMAALSAAYQITGDESYIANAMRSAARRLELARAIGDDSRGHGCAGGSAKGVAGYDVMASLIPATLGVPGLCFDGFGHYKVLATYRGPHGALGLPRETAALFRYGSLDECVARIVNLGDEPTTVMVTSHDGLMRRRHDGAPYPISRQRFHDLDRIPPPWEQVGNEAVRLEPGQEREVRIPFPKELEVSRGR